MNIQDYLYEAMFHRKSIRKFKDEMLDNNVVRSVEERIKQLRPLFPEEQIAFRILSDNQIKGQVKGSTHHIAVYAKQGLKSYVNAGFMMQQMDLWLSAMVWEVGGMSVRNPQSSGVLLRDCLLCSS